MGPKRFLSKKFSLFIVKFKKLGFSAPLSHKLQINIASALSCNFKYSKIEFTFDMRYYKQKIEFHDLNATTHVSTTLFSTNHVYKQIIGNQVITSSKIEMQYTTQLQPAAASHF